MPTIETIKMRNYIVRTSDLINNGTPILLDENIQVNCYAYALGIIYVNPEHVRFNPGFTEDLIYSGKDSSQLIENVCIDLKNLNLKFRKLGVNDNKKLKKHEYLIKVFYAPPNYNFPSGDFHFLRQDSKTGYWFHKPGLSRQPEILSSDIDLPDYTVGEEPDIITSLNEDGFFYELRPVGYFAITEK